MVLRFDLAQMYVEVVGIFTLIILGTFSFSYHAQIPWLAPFVLLTSAVILSGAGLWKHNHRLAMSKKDDDATEQLDMILSGAVWLVWLVYGELFKDVAPIMSGWAAYVHGAIIAVLVLLSHSRDNIRREGAWSTSLIVAVTALLFIPHPDMMSQHLPIPILFVKVCVFYILFGIAEMATKLDFDARRRAGDVPTRLERVFATQIQIVQSAWVLLSIFPLIAISIAQCMLLLREIRRHMRARRARDTLLPTVAPSSSVPPQNGERRRRRRRRRARKNKSEDATKAIAPRRTVVRLPDSLDPDFFDQFEHRVRGKEEV